MLINDSISVNDFRKICRTCLAEGDMKYLYEKCPEEVCLIEMLMSVTFVRFSGYDGLPFQICLNCVEQLIKAYKFSQKSLQVDKKLRNCLKEYKNKINNEIKLFSSQNSESEPTDKQMPEPQNDEEQIKTEIEIEEHNIEMPSGMVLVKPEILSENENNEIKFFSSQNSKSESTDKQMPEPQNEEQIKTEIEIEEHNIEMPSGMVIVKPEKLSENENNDDNLLQNENDDDFLPEISDSNDVETNETNLNGEKQSANNKKQKTSETKEGLPFECHKCSATFATHKLLWLHRREVKHPHFTNCKICSKSVSTVNISKHMKTHKGDRPFSCDLCENRYYAKAHLKRHQLSHTGERPYKCTTCGQGFFDASKLKQHMRIHTGEKPYVCDVCGKQFIRKSHLDLHVKIHSEERPYKEIKEKRKERNREYQREWRQRKKDLKKKVSEEEKKKEKRKRHRENQKAYYQRRKRLKENVQNVEEIIQNKSDDLQM